MFKNKMIQAALLILVPLETAYSLPDPSLGNPLSKFRSISGLKGSAIFQDHDKKSTLYVSPPAQKDVYGGFYLTDGFPDCRDLNQLRKLTYRMPKEEDFESVTFSNRPYSPAFDSTIGIASKHQHLILKIIEAKSEVSDFKNQHSELYGDYAAAKSQKETLEEKLELSKQQQQQLNANLQSEIAALMVLDISQAEKERQLDAIRDDHKKQIASLLTTRAQLSSDYTTALALFHEANRKWAPYQERLNDLIEFEQSINLSFDSLMNISQASFDRSRRLIEEMQSKLIGWGNIGFSLSGDESEKLSQMIAEQGLEYDVSPLPIFNVKTYSGVSKIPSNLDFEESGQDITMKYMANTIWFPSETMQVVGEQRLEATEFVSGTDGQPVNILMGEKIDQPRSLSVPVTFGALCGYPQLTRRSYNLNGEGSQSDINIEYTDYAFPEPSTKVVNEAVVAKYNYYMKAERLSGKCSLDTNKTDKYLRNAGYQKKWSLFGSSTKSWDDTSRSIYEQMGFNCTVTKRPTGANEAEAQENFKRLEKALHDDMFALFITNFAKEYKVEIADLPEAPEQSRPLATIGSAVFNLCGALNKYCAITGIVLKTVEELGGSRHNGSTSAESNYAGHIHRSFDVDSYMIGTGETVLNLKVCLDEDAC